MYRNGYLTDPFFINDSKEFCRDNKVTDLVVALNQPSAGAAYKSSSDELLFWNHLFGETDTHELSETYDDYLDKLTEYFYCQNNQLLTLPSMVHPSVYLDTLTASLETPNDIYEDDDVISISSPLPALSVLSSSSSLPVFSFCAFPSSIVPVISAIVPVISAIVPVISASALPSSRVPVFLVGSTHINDGLMMSAVPSHPVEDGEEVVNGFVVGSELQEHEQPPHPTPKVISPEDERPHVVDPSLVADFYLRSCAEPISSTIPG